MRKNVKSPLIAEGDNFIHRRPMFNRTTVNEQGYFTRYAGVNAKPEVQR